MFRTGQRLATPFQIRRAESTLRGLNRCRGPGDRVMSANEEATMQPMPSNRDRNLRHPDAMRLAVLDLMERATPDPGSDEAYFLAQLRTVVATFETPADRLFARYRGWPSEPARFSGGHRM
jgi:hypothetical protein